MMNKFYPLALAMVLGAAAFAVPGASAMTLPAAPPTVADGVTNGDNPLLQEVHKRRYWDRRYDGRRYKNRRGSYRHFHDGYYYRSPWWALSIPLGLGVIVYHDRDYCRRRGYSRNHSWSYSGRRHRCRY